MSKGGIPLGEWSGSAATDALHAIIDQYQKESSRQTAKMIRLTLVNHGSHRCFDDWSVRADLAGVLSTTPLMGS